MSIPEDTASVPRRDDRRRYARKNLRSAALARYALRLAETHDNPLYVVLTRDVSKGGTAFYQTRQAMPSERIWVVFLHAFLQKLYGSPACLFEVCRCRRVERNCYLIGAERILDYPSWQLPRWSDLD